MSYGKLNFTGQGKIHQVYTLRMDTENTYLVYDRKINEVGLLYNYIATFGSGATARFDQSGMTVFGTVDEFIAYTLSLANTKAPDLTLDEYAVHFSLRKTDVRRFCATAYAYVLGVRRIGNRYSSVYTIPIVLKPDYWKDLRIMNQGSKMRLAILNELTGEFVHLSDVLDKLSPPYNRDVLLKTIYRLVKSGVLTKTGERRWAKVRLT